MTNFELNENDSDLLYSVLSSFPDFYFNHGANGGKGLYESDGLFRLNPEEFSLLKRIKGQLSGKRQCETNGCLGEIVIIRQNNDDSDVESVFEQCNDCGGSYRELSAA